MAGETGTETGGQTSTGTSQTDTQTGPVTKDGKTDLATLPADVQTLIHNLREEAKENRLAKEAAETKVQGLTDDLEAAQAASRLMSEESEKATRALTLRELREEYGLDKKAEKFLTGKTPEELKEQAEALSTFVKPPENNEGTETGGDTGGGTGRQTDPAQQGQETLDEDAARVQAFFGG